MVSQYAHFHIHPEHQSLASSNFDYIQNTIKYLAIIFNFTTSSRLVQVNAKHTSCFQCLSVPRVMNTKALVAIVGLHAVLAT